MRTWARAAAGALLGALALAGIAVALAISGVAGAGTGAETTTTTAPTTTEPPTTTETLPTEPAPTEPSTSPAPPRPAPIAFGVTVGGVRVGGLMPQRATVVVRRSFTRPLTLVVDPTRTVRLAPGALGARPNVAKAIRRSRLARPGASVPLDVSVSRARVRAYVERLAGRFDRTAADARLELVGVRPRAIPAREGRHLKQLVAGRSIRAALARNSRAPITLPFDLLEPKVASVRLDEAIVILRGSNRLLYFDHAKYDRWFPVATGQASYPTPLGAYEIVTMQRDPWWYPPPSPWAADEQAVPPGPGNPLGTRWMGLSAPYVGIHGTPDAASIGYSASHGCIRMRISDAEWLFQHVKVGTPVFIIAK